MDPSVWPNAWLQNNIAPLISSPTFQKDGLLIIVFDEAETNDSTHGGGIEFESAASETGTQGQPWFYPRLVAYGYFWFSGGIACNV
jgi:hypothetical protein